MNAPDWRLDFCTPATPLIETQRCLKEDRQNCVAQLGNTPKSFQRCSQLSVKAEILLPPSETHIIDYDIKPNQPIYRL